VPRKLLRGLFVVFFDFPVCHGIDFVAPWADIWDCKINEKKSFYRFFVYLCSPKRADGPSWTSEKIDK
jgi:hypothetical protein